MGNAKNRDAFCEGVQSSVGKVRPSAMQTCLICNDTLNELINIVN